MVSVDNSLVLVDEGGVQRILLRLVELKTYSGMLRKPISAYSSKSMAGLRQAYTPLKLEEIR
ncbi:MAG: hypothetical protein QXV04_04685 [Desulfurococcaceae archaeon]